jgi:hypothetical protein
MRLRPWAIITSDGIRREVTPMTGEDTNKIKTWRNGVQKAVGGDFSGPGLIPSRELRINTVEGSFRLNNNGFQLEELYNDHPDLFEGLLLAASPWKGRCDCGEGAPGAMTNQGICYECLCCRTGRPTIGSPEKPRSPFPAPHRAWQAVAQLRAIPGVRAQAQRG